ncbi:unnamed protein product [Meloidogyne enterolobii]|uniref:Uncharacterized protein n=1 Tax=Meloidogyne enterolobii TaxID=390850 RepID=A0ACB0YAB7_MELEN
MNLRGAIGYMPNVFRMLSIRVGCWPAFTLGDEETWHLLFLLSYIPISVQLTLLGFFCPPKNSYIVYGNFMEAVCTCIPASRTSTLQSSNTTTRYFYGNHHHRIYNKNMSHRPFQIVEFVGQIGHRDVIVSIPHISDGLGR